MLLILIILKRVFNLSFFWLGLHCLNSFILFYTLLNLFNYYLFIISNLLAAWH